MCQIVYFYSDIAGGFTGSEKIIKLKKQNNDKEKVFENAYKKYYVDLIQAILEQNGLTKFVYPSKPEQEAIVEECRLIDCAFRFIDQATDDLIKPLFNGDKLYIFSAEISNKDFFRLIHPAFLVPYLIFGGFAYELAAEIQASWREIIKINYQISLPLKLPGQEYFWYLQKSRVLAINEKNGVLSHINTYSPLRKFKEFSDRGENIFIEATILSNNVVHERFQKLLENKMSEYYKKNVFKKQHWNVIHAHLRGEVPAIKYTKLTIYDLNKQIKKLMEVHTGYRFQDINEIIGFLKQIRVI